MLSVYPACFFKEGNGYSVVFPDLRWLSTSGEDLPGAMSAAVDCLAGYLYTCQKDLEKAPAPSPVGTVDLAAIARDLDVPAKDSFVNLVSVDVNAYAKEHFEKSIKKTLTIPVWLNKAALEQGINFSQVLQEALLAKVQTRH